MPSPESAHNSFQNKLNQTLSKTQTVPNSQENSTPPRFQK